MVYSLRHVGPDVFLEMSVKSSSRFLSSWPWYSHWIAPTSTPPMFIFIKSCFSTVTNICPSCFWWCTQCLVPLLDCKPSEGGDQCQLCSWLSSQCSADGQALPIAWEIFIKWMTKWLSDELISGITCKIQWEITMLRSIGVFFFFQPPLMGTWRDEEIHSFVHPFFL